MLLVIVSWTEVDDGVDETEGEAFRGPANCDVDSHVVAIDRDVVAITPRGKMASVS